MEGYLKVTPEKLMSSSEEFNAAAVDMSNLTSEMINLVSSLSGVWQGEASGTFKNRFCELQSDMDKLYRMVMEHSSDLSEMARGYAEAESMNTEKGSGMNVNVVN